MGQFKFIPPRAPLLSSIHLLFTVSHWQTAEHLTLTSLGKSPVEDPTPSNGEKGVREKSTFQEDESLPVAFRAKLQDYFRSGYDRGHMYVNYHCFTLFCVTS